MSRLAHVLNVMALLAGIPVLSSPLFATDKILTNKEIMVKLNQTPKGLCPVIGKAVKEKEPKWSEIQAQAKEFAELTAALAKNDPPKGSKESWEKLTKAYAKNAKDLADAAENMDYKKAIAAHAKLRTSCKSCHDSHKNK